MVAGMATELTPSARDLALQAAHRGVQSPRLYRDGARKRVGDGQIISGVCSPVARTLELTVASWQRPWPGKAAGPLGNANGDLGCDLLGQVQTSPWRDERPLTSSSLVSLRGNHINELSAARI